MKNLRQFILSFSLLLIFVCAAKSEIKTITGDVTPAEATAFHDFVVISFHTNDPETKDIDSIMEGAKRYFDKKVADGDWEDRSLGWYRINLDQDPDYAVTTESRDSDQMISGFG